MAMHTDCKPEHDEEDREARKCSGRAGESESNGRMKEIVYYWGGGAKESIILLERSQASSLRLSGKGSVKMKT
jgi:hypothetical protein